MSDLLYKKKWERAMVLSDEQKKKYLIMSRTRCEGYCKQKHDASSVIISIRSSWDKVLPGLSRTKTNNVKAILFLAFDDIDKEDGPEHCMSYEQGRKVAAFVNGYYDDVERIIVHCDGGISRSAGVAAAIMRVKEGNDIPVFGNKRKYPNMTCYLATLKGFGYI